MFFSYISLCQTCDPWGGQIICHHVDAFVILLNLICNMTMFWNKRALGPWVTHLRMTDQWSGTICETLVECIMRNNSVKLFWIWVSGSKEDVVQKISNLELWQSSCLVQKNHLCNFERWHHGEYSCEVTWNLDQLFKKRSCLKTFLI